MSLRKKIKETNVVVLFILLLVTIYITYHLVIFLAKSFVYLGFNLFLGTDNLLKFQLINPIVLWGILGLIIGSVFGVTIAVKKFKLSKVLILYPLSFAIICIIILSFINKPTDVSGTFNSPTFSQTTESTARENKMVKYATVPRAMYLRSLPSAGSMKLITLPRGSQIEIIDTIRDNKNSIWSKIKYTNPQTYKISIGFIYGNYLNTLIR